jgi:hypothetical protein
MEGLNMIDQELRVAVAKEVGWKKREELSSPWNNVWEYKGEIVRGAPPLFHCSLDAMHEAWKTLTVDEHKAFRNHLMQIVVRDGVIPGAPSASVSNASARQRAEAFVETKNKRKE